MSPRACPRAPWGALLFALLALSACGEDSPRPSPDSGTEPDAGARPADPFADVVVSFQPGETAGFGQDRFPDVVLGPPRGAGDSNGSLDVLSLGKGGSIVLRFTDVGVVDGPGVDFLVFENPFLLANGSTYAETGEVAVSEDGVNWTTFPCAFTDAAGGYPGCAGVRPVLSDPTNGVSPTDPAVAGGDGFDLATVGLKRARFVRITDTGTNKYGGTSGGFDLDAVAVVHGESLSGTSP
ncbi:cell surface protein [Corallococcus sp. M34]|uniref:cell surface protein n=1 Tax=Citreicoccus inhibens TaxID=2849499 RepID=UPI001C23237D|nr:cell surface protein [Citreicoccus inhibens]MBU8895597.1 cell surface protein [Citreicoccus inhibens]